MAETTILLYSYGNPAIVLFMRRSIVLAHFANGYFFVSKKRSGIFFLCWVFIYFEKPHFIYLQCHRCLIGFSGERQKIDVFGDLLLYLVHKRESGPRSHKYAFISKKT